MADNIFVDGMIAKKPHEKAPDFVKANLSVKLGDFIRFADPHKKNGWVNIVIKEGRSGKYYAELDTYEPKKPDPSTGEVAPEELPETLETPDTTTSQGVNGEQIDLNDIPF